MTTEQIIHEFEFLRLKIGELQKLLEVKEKPEETIDYSVNWDEAPEWADSHAYDESGEGFWYGPHLGNNSVRFSTTDFSNWKIGESVMEIHKKTWKNSKTLRPLNF